MEKEFPRYLIGYNSDYLNIFIELLQTGNEECKREVLSLLEILPMNYDIKDYIREGVTKFNTETKIEQWEKFFNWDGTDLSKAVYYLMCLEEMMIPRKEIAN
jgi:hypothetical protein